MRLYVNIQFVIKNAPGETVPIGVLIGAFISAFIDAFIGALFVCQIDRYRYSA